MQKMSTSSILESCHRIWHQQRQLCDALELIADSLPDSVDKALCMQTARMLPTIISSAHELEETGLFTALEHADIGSFDPGPTLERLRLEHAGDECFAEELSEVLMSWGRGAPANSAEAMGYMLRGFFEALRRHIATEEELAAMLARAQKRARPGGRATVRRTTH